jgi:hypothetical protein
VRHLGLQGHDAVIQADRLAPSDEGLAADLGAIAANVLAFAEREAVEAARVLGAGEPTAEDIAPAPGEELVARRLRWGAPPADALAEATRARLGELAKAGKRELDLGRVWRWVNGRRTARVIAQRLRHGGAVPLKTVVEYLRLMEQEGAVCISPGEGSR